MSPPPPRFVYFSKTPVGCVSRQRVGLWTSARLNGSWHPSPASPQGVENFCDLSPARTRSEPPALYVSRVIFVFETRSFPVTIAGRDVRVLADQSNVNEKKKTGKYSARQITIIYSYEICQKTSSQLTGSFFFLLISIRPEHFSRVKCPSGSLSSIEFVNRGSDKHPKCEIRSWPFPNGPQVATVRWPT